MLYFLSYDINDCFFSYIRGRCVLGDFYDTSYKWLSRYCNFFPPIFLSTDKEKLFGCKSDNKVIVGFKKIDGFPVCFDEWEKISGILANLDTSDFGLMQEYLFGMLKDMESNESSNLFTFDSFKSYLKKKVFIEKDQYAVKGVDFRKSCVIICRNEIDKNFMVKRGFPSHIIKTSFNYGNFG